MGRVMRKLWVAVPLSAAWLLVAGYAGATGATAFDLVAITALVTSPAVGWTWRWVLEKPAT
jgi:hypothetical protein